MTINKSMNKGEWSELYAFIKLLKDGKIYAADENVNRIEDVFFPILKLYRQNEQNETIDYHTGKIIKIYKDGVLLGEVSIEKLIESSRLLFNKIFEGGQAGTGAFEIPEIKDFLDEMKIDRIKAPAGDKVDIRMQVHDIKTGYTPIAGFSIKSDVGNPPTLLNAGKNTRFKYEILGFDDEKMNDINSIDKSVEREYIKARMSKLVLLAEKIKYHSMKSDIYEDNLMMIDTMLPEIYGSFILYHYLTLNDNALDCSALCELLEAKNPLGYRNPAVYKYKIKKLLSAAALGMTPGTKWDGNEAATGGYIIIKRDGDVLCYHLYNRNFFEEYLLKNTTVDRPSLTRHDFGYVYKEDGKYFIDFNIQIRFKSIKSGNKIDERYEESVRRMSLYLNTTNII